MTDVDRVGGVPVVMKALLDAGLMHGDVMTVTGRTMAENLADIAPPDLDGKVVRAMSEPIHRTGGLTILRGSLAPDGAVVKTAGLRRRRVRGHRAGVRPRAGGDGRARGRHDRGRRRRGDPVRGPEGRAGDARDARHHRRDQGRRPRQGRAAAHRRPVLRRHDRALRRARRAGGGRRRADRARRRRRPDPARRRRPRRSTCSSTTTSSPGAATSWQPLPPRYPGGVLAKYTQARRLRRHGAVCD